MFKLAVVAALVALAIAQPPPPPPTRPVIAESFKAEVDSQFEEHNRTLIGEGRFAVDIKGNRGVSLHEVEDQEHHRRTIYDLDRFDLGHEYTINSEDREDCHERALTGHMRPFFEWVHNATYAGKKQTPHHQTVDVWEAKFGSTTLLIGVLEDAPHVPLITEETSVHGTSKHFWREFNATVPEASFFDVPRECGKAQAEAAPARTGARPALRADPPRPRIPVNFHAEVDSQFEEHNRTLIGRGRMAVDYTANKFVELHEVEDHEHRPLHIFDLARFDLHHEYEINSEDRNDCHERNATGHVEDVFKWVENATYLGKKQTPHHQTVDVWGVKFGSTELAVGVLETSPNAPLILERRSAHGAEKFFFREFNTSAVPADIFDVPKECQAAPALRADPPRPRIAETFESTVDFAVTRGDHEASGRGKLDSDLQAGKFAQFSDTQAGSHEILIHEVSRFDLHEAYSVDSISKECHKRELHGEMVPPFRWVEQAKFEGVKKIGKKQIECQVWGSEFGSVKFYLGVLESDPHTPKFFAQLSGNDGVEMEFVSFNASSAPAADFDIPKECSQ